MEPLNKWELWRAQIDAQPRSLPPRGNLLCVAQTAASHCNLQSLSLSAVGALLVALCLWVFAPPFAKSQSSMGVSFVRVGIWALVAASLILLVPIAQALRY